MSTMYIRKTSWEHYYYYIKDRHDPRNKYQRKSNVARVNGAGGIRCPETFTRSFRGQSPLRKLSGSKEQNLSGSKTFRLKIDLNAAEIINVENYKWTKNYIEWKVLKL